MPVAARPASYADGNAHRRFTVAEFNRLLALGILTAADRVELLEGWVVLKAPHDPEHDCVVARLGERLVTWLPDGWACRVQRAVTLGASQPEPDLAVVRGSYRDNESHHPFSSEVGLVVEVANTSLQRDTLDKTRVYAADAIPEYWVVDVANRRVEVYAAPAGGAYTTHRTLLPGDTLPLTLDSAVVAHLPVADLVP